MDSGISQYSPSFSSTLLDAIYRSIDLGDEEMVIYRETIGKKQSANVRGGVFRSEEEMANFRRACMIEKWMEKKASEKEAVRRKPADDLQMKRPRKLDRPDSSSWSSSDSSGGGGGGFFSSSEAESFPLPRPKPVRTGGSRFEKEKIGQKHRDSESDIRGRRGLLDELDSKPKHEGGFLKTKSRALKIYGDLKKVQQPMSPGGRLAGFLNSLFTGAGKPKISGGGNGEYPPSLKSTNTSTCSSASSFSRSCLSKTPSSRDKSSNGAKRSVRFSPVSVIVDEDCQPCGHKSLLQNNRKQTSNFEVTKNDTTTMGKNRRAVEVARDLLRNYQIKTHDQFKSSFDHNLRKSNFKNHKSFNREDVEEDDDDDDAASYASSDLFELDNLSSIGMERYREELPVYKTTRLHHTTRDVGNGLNF
ncbi:hypothetical protein OROGR_005112 [Orobanche gracilis]